MAAPILTDIRLPDDSGNTGKRVQTQSESIGGNTVHAHYYIQRSRRKLLGLHRFVTALNSVQASATNGTTTGFWWLHVPVGSSINLRLRRLYTEFSMITELDHLTVPRIALAKFTFTGTASGATITPMLSKTGMTAPVGSLRTASTGLTVTLGALGWNAIVPSYTLTTSGLAWSWSRSEFEPDDEESFMDIAPGEGLVLYQPDAGTATDGRRFTCAGLWDEYDNT